MRIDFDNWVDIHMNNPFIGIAITIIGFLLAIFGVLVIDIEERVIFLLNNSEERVKH